MRTKLLTLSPGLLRCDGLVRATWSDAAREAAMEARKLAAKSSQKAYGESAKLEDNAAEEAHKPAAKAHWDAYFAHQKARIVLRGSGAIEAIEHHAGMMSQHKDQAHAHEMGQHMPHVKASSIKETSTKLVQCRDMGSALVLAESALWELDKPVDWQWMPGGVHVITAHYDGAPVTMAVQCDETTAKAVQASFEDWMKRNAPQEPFACVEHREEEAAVRPRAFAWKETPAPGVYCTGLPTELGARNVNGRIHRSFSPTFACDAEWDKATCVKCSKPCGDDCGCGEGIAFPDGVRGSATNPCRITGVASSIGSLTNKPAFRKILPVRAKDATDGKQVEATWSDAAREAAAEARKREGGGLLKRKHEESKQHHQEEAKQAGKDYSKAGSSQEMEASHKTRLAHMASAKAYETGSPVHHYEASRAHLAAKDAAGAVNDEGMGRGHLAHAAVHDALAHNETTHNWVTAKVAPDTSDTVLARLAAEAGLVTASGTHESETTEQILERLVRASGTSEGAKKGWESRGHALVTDTNGRSRGRMAVQVNNDGVELKHDSKTYYRTGKQGTSPGAHETHAPKGTPMHEYRHYGEDGDKDVRLWATKGGSHIHED